jgi:hypothetical protein
MPMSAIKFKSRGRVSIRFPASPQLLKEGLCCSERRPLFRGVAREKAQAGSHLQGEHSRRGQTGRVASPRRPPSSTRSARRSTSTPSRVGHYNAHANSSCRDRIVSGKRRSVISLLGTLLPPSLAPWQNCRRSYPRRTWPPRRLTPVRRPRAQLRHGHN